MRKLKILVDRCVHPKMAVTLRKTGLHSVSLAEQFGEAAQSLEDIEWLKWAGQNGYAVLTANPRIWSVPYERAALIDHGTQVFCIANAQTTREDRAYVVGRHIMSIMNKMEASEACFWRLNMQPPITYDL